MVRGIHPTSSAQTGQYTAVGWHGDFRGNGSCRLSPCAIPASNQGPQFRIARRGKATQSEAGRSALPAIYSNSSHLLKRLPKMNVRAFVVMEMRPFTLSVRVTRSWTPRVFDEKSPSNDVKPISRSFVMKTAP